MRSTHGRAPRHPDLKADPQADLRSFFDDTVLMNVDNRPISPRSPGQRPTCRSSDNTT